MKYPGYGIAHRYRISKLTARVNSHSNLYPLLLECAQLSQFSRRDPHGKELLAQFSWSCREAAEQTRDPQSGVEWDEERQHQQPTLQRQVL